VEHKLFKDKAEGETVNCPECKHLISKGQLKKFNYLGEIRETVVRLKDGHHAKEENVSKEAENLEEELSKERQKNEWLLQQNIGI
jgi:phage terminase large subunit GpA-like protein